MELWKVIWGDANFRSQEIFDDYYAAKDFGEGRLALGFKYIIRAA